MHSGYDKIIGGKVNYVLSDLTGGQPLELVLEKF